MDVNEIMKVVLGLAGGLAIFLYGMNTMSGSLQEVAGERMRSILAAVTKNPVMGVLAGALATAVLQSSSATTVMVIGFVSARIMSLRQAIPIVMGANIGTTITAQIIAFKLSDYILLFVAVGFLVMTLARGERVKLSGRAIFGFGLLFVGIETMGSVMKPLAESPVFTEMIAQVAGVPVLGVLVGTVMTLVVQSSSATIAVLQNFAAQPGADGASILGLEGAIPILLGDNLGTTVTALLASIGQSRDAKRVALAHCIFNLSGCPALRRADRSLRDDRGSHSSRRRGRRDHRAADRQRAYLLQRRDDAHLASARLAHDKARHADTARASGAPA